MTTCAGYTRKLANAAFREAITERTRCRVRRREDDEACGACASDVADYQCLRCEDLICYSCRRQCASCGGVLCEHCKAESEDCPTCRAEREQSMELKQGDAFVKDLGDGFRAYKIVTGVTSEGFAHGVSFLSNEEGRMFSLTIENYITAMGVGDMAKYAQPVEVPQERVEAVPPLRCPECGYTKEDSAMWLDHHLCKGTIPSEAQQEQHEAA